MENNIEKILQLSVVADCSDETAALIQQAQQRIQANRCHLAFIGENKSGKTTLINGVVGAQIREPSLLDQNEKPLRVAFEQMDADARFDCITTFSREWNDESALIFEMRNSHAFEADGRHSALLNEMDCAVYVLSALAPFTKRDVDALTALQSIPVQVVVTHMDEAVGTPEQIDRLKEYIRQNCAKCGAGEPLYVVDENYAELSAAIRRFLPAPDRLAQLRQAHSKAILLDAARLVERRIAAAQSDSASAQAVQSEKQAEERLRASEKQAQWGSLAADLREMGVARCEEITDRRIDLTGITNELFSCAKSVNFNQADIEDKFPKRIHSRLSGAFHNAYPDLERCMRDDFDAICDRAAELGGAATRINPDADPVFTAVGTPDKSDLQLDRRLSTRSKITMIVSGALLGLQLLPMPASVASSILWSSVAVINGSAAYLTEKQRWEEDAWRHAIDEYVRENAKVYCANARTAISGVYAQMLEELNQLSDAAAAPAAAPVTGSNRLDNAEQQIKTLIAEMV